jgi:hypothetical protein
MKQGITLTSLKHRYAAYKESVMLLRASNQSVASRKSAIFVRDEFEKDVRDGILDGLFDEMENWL